MKSSSLTQSYIYVFISAVLFGFLVFGGGMMGKYGFSLIEVLIIPNTVIFFFLLWFVRKDLKSFFRVPLWISIFYPINCILEQIGQLAPLFVGVSVSLVVFLLYTQPIWTILISSTFLKQKFTKTEAVVTVSVITGLVILLAPWREMTYSVLGVILALIGGLCMSGWVIIGAYYTRNNIKPVTTTFFTNLYTSLPFILAYPFLLKLAPAPEISGFSFDRSIVMMICVIIYSLTVFVAAPMFFYKGSRKVNDIHLGLILLIEPVVGVALDVVFLGTTFTWNIAAGGALILFANMCLILKTTK
ncbi:MAG: DMT family transporter [Lactobacillaceae bacterium]|jgi:drug/metabolite transporter (DMT)-like permease|nr:DMT family transporter [Lactobacillaceae bacterium]